MVKIIRKNKIDITPDKSLMPKIGKTGYNFYQALSELVDNSIDARIGNKLLTIEIILDKDYIEIRDNGKGMNEKEAEKCLVLAYSEKKNRLGEFGLGLKTASQSLGDQFIVWTTTSGEQESYRLSYDEIKWMGNDQDWTNFPFEIIEKQDPLSHGTTVRIKNLKMKTQGRIVSMRNALGKRFAPYIENDEVEIIVNGVKCKPTDYDLLDPGKQYFALDSSLNIHVHGWYGLLKEGSQKGEYGFHTYRRGRLISSFEKIGFSAHATVARIIGEIYMDDVPVTHNKREWLKESKEYQSVEELMTEEMKEIVRKARQKSNIDRIGKNALERTILWMDKFTQVFKTELKEYAKPTANSNVKFKSDPDGDILLETEIEKRASPSNPSSPHFPSTVKKDRNPKITQNKEIPHVIVRGKKFKFKHEYRGLGKNHSWKDRDETEDGVIEISTNIDFPAFTACRDPSYYAAYIIAETLAEIVVEKAGESYDNVDDVKQVLLSKAGELISQI